MYRYKNILVGLNWDDHDPSIIHYAGYFSKLCKAEKVTFFHVYNPNEVPHEIQAIHEEFRGLSEECTQNCLKELIEPNWEGDPSTKVEYKVEEEGHPLAVLLKHAKDDGVDLLMVGRKVGRRQTGTISESLVRKAPCSVLVVPWGVREFFKNVLVPVDFSTHSKDAVELAVSIGEAAGLQKIHTSYIYDVPLGYHKTGKTYAEVDEIMRLHSKEEYDAFMKGVDTRGLEMHAIFKLNRHPDEEILDLSWEIPADLIVMGSRGRGAIASVLLGSNTEYIVRNATVPVLAVKEKGQGMSLLDAFLELAHADN